jgi:exodeoxyribonuclease-3
MDKKISFLSLNIGNPSLDRARKQCEWLDKRPEDVFILTETKNSQGCSYIEDFFLQYGYDLFSMNSLLDFSVSFPKSKTGDLGVMIVSKHQIVKSMNFFKEDSIFYARQLETIISIENLQISVVGLYVPSRDRSDEKIMRKKSFVDSIEEFITESRDVSRVIMGDFNILDRNHIPHYSTFFEWEYSFYDKIICEGYVDAYKYCNHEKQEYSWVGRTNDGYRYDYAFASADLRDKIAECKYIHDTRKNGLTDHSAIVMELKVKTL